MSGITEEIADTAEALLARHRPDRVAIRDGQLHLTFALNGDDGAPTSEDLLRLLNLQVTVRDVRVERGTGGVMVVACALAACLVPAPSPVVPDVPEPWYSLAGCESDRTWDYDGLHQGGLQFAHGTWDAFKPDGFPDGAHQATKFQQVVVAERVLEAQGWQAWPVCSRQIGLRP